MKVSELMLDMAAGDASIHDVYVQECLGRINVSSGIFDAAYKISELPDEDIPYIMEAAGNAGLPTNRGEAIGVANEAVIQELSAFYDLMIATSKKVRAAAQKDLRGISAIGRKYGINFNASMDSEEFIAKFLEPLCDAIAKDGGREDLGEKCFIKTKYAGRMVENYGKGMANLMSGYGLSIDNAFDEYVVHLLIKKDVSAKRTIQDLRDVASNMTTGGKQLNFDKTVEKSTHYQSYVRTIDFKMLAISIYATMVIADAVVRVLGTAATKKAAITNVKSLCDAASSGGKRVTRSAETISDGVKEWSENLNNLTSNMTKAFTDSTYNLLKLYNRPKGSK